MTWAMLEKGYRIGYCRGCDRVHRRADDVRQFYQQRKRWSRGLIEALQRAPGLLFKRRLVTLFVWWNMLFLPLDLTFTFIFIPGVVAALLRLYLDRRAADPAAAAARGRLERRHLPDPAQDVRGQGAQGPPQRRWPPVLRARLRNRHAAGLPVGLHCRTHRPAQKLGNQMIINLHRRLGLLAALGALGSAAQAQDAPTANANGPAAGVELFASTDSDHTDVVKLLGRFSVLDNGPDNYLGLAVEQAWFTPLGGRTRKQERVYADLAGKAGANLLWKAKIGTDGRTWLGSAGLRTKDWSKEIFLEREILETPRGVDEGIYYTFVGASGDVPVSPIDTLTLTGALQTFTGKNERLHARASFVHVIKPGLGLSLQLRTRYFHSTKPGEFDYYSPRNFFRRYRSSKCAGSHHRAGWSLAPPASACSAQQEAVGRPQGLPISAWKARAAPAASERSARSNIPIIRSMDRATIIT